jgi:Ca2+-binding EF-hand superfamily protein
MSDFDTDESGIIEFKEFVKMMTMNPSESDTHEDINHVFD